MKQKTFNCFRKGKRDVRAGTAKSKSAKKDTHIALINFPRSGMEHFVRTSYPRSKMLHSLKRQRTGRISQLSDNKNIPTFVLPLKGERNYFCPNTWHSGVHLWQSCNLQPDRTIKHFQVMRQPSNTRGTLANISLRMLLEKREENMLGIERFFSNGYC